MQVESKDYRDIAALLRAGLPLKKGMENACALFASQFPPAECMKALTFFQGGDMATLSEEDKLILLEHVKKMPLTPLEPARIITDELAVYGW